MSNTVLQVDQEGWARTRDDFTVPALAFSTVSGENGWLELFSAGILLASFEHGQVEHG